MLKYKEFLNIYEDIYLPTYNELIKEYLQINNSIVLSNININELNENLLIEGWNDSETSDFKRKVKVKVGKSKIGNFIRQKYNTLRSHLISKYKDKLANNPNDKKGIVDWFKKQMDRLKSWFGEKMYKKSYEYKVDNK